MDQPMSTPKGIEDTKDARVRVAEIVREARKTQSEEILVDRWTPEDVADRILAALGEGWEGEQEDSAGRADAPSATLPADPKCPKCGYGTEPCAPDWCFRCDEPIPADPVETETGEPTRDDLVRIIRDVWPDVGELVHEANGKALRFDRGGKRWRATPRRYPPCLFMVEEVAGGFLSGSEEAQRMQLELHNAFRSTPVASEERERIYQFRLKGDDDRSVWRDADKWYWKDLPGIYEKRVVTLVHTREPEADSPRREGR